MKRFFWFVAVVFLFFGRGVFSLTLQIDLKDEVKLYTGRLTLGDVATVSYPDPQWEERIRKNELGALPSPGEVRVVKPQDIYRRVVSKNIPGLDYIYFQGSDLCRVMVAGEKIDLQELTERLTQEIQNRFFPEAQKVEVELLGSGDNLVVTQGSSFDLELPAAVSLRGPNKGAVREHGGKESIPFTFRVRVYREVLRANREILPQETLREEDFSLHLEVLSPENEKALSSAEDVLGKKAKKRLKAGEVITETVLARETLIQRGDLVTIVAQKGGIVITATGKSRGNGSLGDTIIVENLTSRKRMEAEVIGERMVQVRIK